MIEIRGNIRFLARSRFVIFISYFRAEACIRTLASVGMSIGWHPPQNVQGYYAIANRQYGMRVTVSKLQLKHAHVN